PVIATLTLHAALPISYRRGDPDYRSTTRDVRRLLSELQEQNIDGIVLDLRNNGGGSLQEATELTGLFIGQGPSEQAGQLGGLLQDRKSTRLNSSHVKI